MSRKNATQNMAWLVWILVGSGIFFALVLCVLGLIILIWSAISG